MFLIIVSGYSGVGKSALCEGINGYKGLKDLIPDSIYYDKDYINDVLTKLFNLPLGTRDGNIYKKFIKPITYSTLNFLARQNLLGKTDLNHLRLYLENLFLDSKLDINTKLIIDNFIKKISKFLTDKKQNVIISATFHKESGDDALAKELYSFWQGLAKDTNSILIHLRPVVKKEKILERMKKRNSHWDKYKLAKGINLTKQKVLGSKNLKPIYLNNEGSFKELLDSSIKILKEKGVRIND